LDARASGGQLAVPLADGRRYLAGHSFGAADLTFAALCGPVLHPPGYGGTRLTLPPMPDELAPQICAWRATPAGQHALRVYREHRATGAGRGL
jgi:glutathione S-transferase